MTQLLSNQNTKLRKDGIFHFSIPAFETANGFRTCPGAKDCIKGCYAVQGFHGMSWVKNAKERRFQATLTSDFAQKMTNEIQSRKVKILRIHDAGDFYSRHYLWQWYRVILTFPDVLFYTYTKMIPFFKGGEAERIPENFKVVLSFGGQWDHMIDALSDHHTKVFKTHDNLVASGYTDCTESDLEAINNKRVGLVYHGGRNLNWGI